MPRLFSRFFQVLLPIIVLINSVVFILYWLTNRLFYSDTNDYLANMVGARRDYISLCLLVSALIGLWSAARLFAYQRRFKHRLSSLTIGLYVVVAVIYLAFFYGSFWLLFRESPVQLRRIGQLLSYFRLVLDTLVLIAAALLIGLWLRKALLRRKPAGQKVTTFPILFALLVFILLWAVPVIFPPGSVFRGNLPPKPLVIAHRGAAMLAPENTLAAANLAASLGVYGLETDLHISRDGIPFLLHDDTFERTTDIKVVYPERVKERAEYFTLAEATRLNAGKWFVERDPYKTIAAGRVSDDQIDEYMLQTVPTLEGELQIVRQNHLAFIFDMKPPPSDQPFASSFFEIYLNEIQKAGIDDQVWFVVDEDQLAALRTTAPAMRPAYGADYREPPSVSELIESGYQMVNAEYGLPKDWIRTYLDANLWVNLYTIDEPWQYSRLWLLGVHSTTTSNAHSLVALDRPVLSLPYGQYLLLWSCVGVLGLALILGFTLAVRTGPEQLYT